MTLADHALALLGWALVGAPIGALICAYICGLVAKRREPIEDDTWKDWPG